MCGISGIINLENKEIKNIEKRIDVMNQAQKHRGPDDGGVWVNNKQTVGLGHRRLSIVDLSPLGHQPMTNEDQSIWIVFNGEIYNHFEIREELIAKGHTYSSKSDTETIIHAYEQWGTKCLDKFRGMFAFAIWDEKKEELFFARDRIGIKPFYYTINDKQFIFASEIKAILSNSKVERKLNEEALYHYLTFFVSPAPQTLFENILKLKPGHFGVIDRRGKLTITEYWDAIRKPNNKRGEADWQELIKTGLKESVKLRMMSDVPFGAYLSGGIDSSVITVMMNEIMDRPIDTFSVGFKKNKNFNELEYAKQICQEYNANYHQVLIDKNDLKLFFDQLIFHQDEPLADWVCFPLYYVSKIIRENKVIVAQVGEGSDELFCGYEGYMRFLNWEKYYRPLLKTPRLFRLILLKLLILVDKIFPISPLVEVFRRASNNEELFWGGAIAFTEYEKDKLLTKKLRQKYNSHRVVKAIYNKFDKETPGRDQLDRMTYLELKNRLAELLLMRVDKISMSVSIEARVPFLDHKFVENMLAIPKDVKISQGPKSILKRALKNIIPANIIYRPKKGFGAPISEWLKEDKFGRYIYDKILKSDFAKQGYLDLNYIKDLFKSHKSNRVDHSVRLWLLANLCGWYDYWIANKMDMKEIK